MLKSNQISLIRTLIRNLKLPASTQPVVDHPCSCNMYQGRTSTNHRQFYVQTRVHSTHNDQHRQKVVIETTTPKIVIDKLGIEKGAEHRKEVWRDTIMPYLRLARWDKPVGVYLLYWPCSWSIAMASVPGNVPLETSLQTAALFLVGAGLMRGAGCTINDMWDRDVDAQVERTKDRPLVTGEVSMTGATVFLAGQLSLALAVLLQLNCYSVVLGASSMLLVVTYPLAKRFSNYPQILLGATFNWGALLGYSAVQGQIDPAVCIPLYIGSLAWTVVYDTIYAHQDKEDDARVGVKSTALTFGDRSRVALGSALALGSAGLAMAGVAAGLSHVYSAALAGFTAILAHQIYTLDTENAQECARKFKSNSLLGGLVLLGIIGGGYNQYRENRRRNAGKEDLESSKSCFLS